MTFTFRGETNINVNCIQQQGGKENERNITLNSKKNIQILLSLQEKKNHTALTKDMTNTASRRHLE